MTTLGQVECQQCRLVALSPCRLVACRLSPVALSPCRLEVQAWPNFSQMYFANLSRNSKHFSHEGRWRRRQATSRQATRRQAASRQATVSPSIHAWRLSIAQHDMDTHWHSRAHAWRLTGCHLLGYYCLLPLSPVAIAACRLVAVVTSVAFGRSPPPEVHIWVTTDEDRIDWASRDSAQAQRLLAGQRRHATAGLR